MTDRLTFVEDGQYDAFHRMQLDGCGRLLEERGGYRSLPPRLRHVDAAVAQALIDRAVAHIDAGIVADPGPPSGFHRRLSIERDAGCREVRWDGPPPQALAGLVRDLKLI